MDFFTSMEVSASGLAAERERMNVASSNLANVSTTRSDEGGPYKRRDVVLQTAEGTRMTTEELHFSNQAQQITSDRLVRVERNGDVLEGTGFASDPNLHHFEFKTKVTATVRTRTGGVIESRGGGK